MRICMCIHMCMCMRMRTCMGMCMCICYMFVCRLVISVQGVILINFSSLGCIVTEILKAYKNVYVYVYYYLLLLLYFILEMGYSQ